MADDEPLVRVERDPAGFARVTLNRPRAANAVNAQVLQELYRAIQDCGGDPSIGAVVLRGEGRHFSAGGDIKEFAARGDDLPIYMVEITAWLNQCVLALVRLPKPVVAAVHGTVAGGGGFGMMCATDLIVAGESTRFFGPGTGLGMSPDAGTTATLTERVGFRTAMELILMNTALTAPEALTAGLINWVVPDDDVQARATEIAIQLANGPRRAVGVSKRLMWSGLEQRLRSQLGLESYVISDLSAGGEVPEGLAAANERRPARFEELNTEVVGGAWV
ncbi:MAG TPA: enoyl-CoA hydratase-related protein [Ilumatobacter sp.]|nr:enoyl-CoA hydratase-related protein [Ilumatobacter sp.]